MATSSSMKKLSGIDLNGIQDYAARNWLLDVDGEELFFGEDNHINLGSIRSSVILVNTIFGKEYVGGIQADLAPHGRGGGFGQIGSPENRVSLIELMRSIENETDKLAAALNGLAPPASHTIVSINDNNDTSEIYQENLVKALRKNKEKSFLLIWRSVLAALSQIQRGKLKRPQKIGVISHSLKGIDLQLLEIKEAFCKEELILVPERKSTGLTVETNFGYQALFDAVKLYLQSLSPDPMLNVENAKNVGLIALGNPGKLELVRSSTGTWREIRPTKTLLDLIEFDGSCLDTLSEFFRHADQVFFETFSTGQLEAKLRKLISSKIGKEIYHIGGTTIAEAALFASKRLEQDCPVYFDFLPQISTIVRSGSKARNFDLIDQSETLRAGKVFRSKVPAELAISPEAEKIEVFLRKETEPRPRKSVVELNMPPGSMTKVLISVEQIPALGRAAIQIKADSIGLNRILDWDNSEILNETWDEILNRQESPVVPIPERLVVDASDFNWDDTDRDGLETLLERAANSNPNWILLAQRAYKSFSSDGEIPVYVSDDAIKNLNKVNTKAIQLIEEILSGDAESNNEILKFLTYQYKICPAKIASTLISMWEYRFDRNYSHPFIVAGGSWVLIFQGFGRIVFDPDLEKKAIRMMIDIPISNWKWREQTACMSFLLSRSKTAHKFLQDEDLPILVERVVIEFNENIGTEYNKFYYAPFLLAGMLRYREINPSFMILGVDPLADKIQPILELTLKDLKRSRTIGSVKRDKYMNWITEIETYMKGEQGNPNLLLDIYNN